MNGVTLIDFYTTTHVHARTHPSLQTSLKGYIGITMSVRLSVCPCKITSGPYLIAALDDHDKTLFLSNFNCLVFDFYGQRVISGSIVMGAASTSWQENH